MMNSEKVVPPLAANMSASFKKVRGAIGASDPVLTDLIVTRIVELAKDGVYDIEELSSRTPYHRAEVRSQKRPSPAVMYCRSRYVQPGPTGKRTVNRDRLPTTRLEA